MKKHKKEKPPERTALVLAIIAALTSIVDNLLEIILKLLDR